jgi:hypothetical protein
VRSAGRNHGIANKGIIMNRLKTPTLVLATVAASLLFSGSLFAQDDPTFPTVTTQPEDQAINVGSDVTFTTDATNADSYQWLRNGVAMDGKTNKCLTIPQITTNDVAYYTCYVANNSEEVPTRSAALNAVACGDGTAGVTVFGPTVFSSGTSSTCPGAYAGYVTYVKTSGWGWTPTGTFHSATDTNRLDTQIVFVGRYGQTGCGQTTVVIPNPTANPKYRFAIYFPNNVPSNNYPITLQGFLP